MSRNLGVEDRTSKGQSVRQPRLVPESLRLEPTQQIRSIRCISEGMSTTTDSESEGRLIGAKLVRAGLSRGSRSTGIRER